MVQRRGKDPLAAAEAAVPHVTRFGVVLFGLLGFFCLATVFALLFINAHYGTVVAPGMLTVLFFYLALYLHHKGRPDPPQNYSVKIGGDNYGGVQQGGQHNTQNIEQQARQSK